MTGSTPKESVIRESEVARCNEGNLEEGSSLAAALESLATLPKVPPQTPCNSPILRRPLQQGERIVTSDSQARKRWGMLLEVANVPWDELLKTENNL